MIPSERRDYIYRYVHEYQLASISALSELMSVSHMTVRRDIRVLEEQGKVVSVSGGVRLSEALRQELAYCEKAQLHHRHKREIGKYAAGLVEDGQVVYLDAGTTTFEIARSLAERFNLTVVTNDFSIIQHLMNRPQLSLFHTGGQVDQRNYSCVGNSAAMLLRSLNIDVAFISTSSWIWSTASPRRTRRRCWSSRRCWRSPAAGCWSPTAASTANTACSASARWRR